MAGRFKKSRLLLVHFLTQCCNLSKRKQSRSLPCSCLSFQLPSICYLYLFLSFQVAGAHIQMCGTPWTVCKSITAPCRDKQDTQPFTLSHNLESLISLIYIFFWSVGGNQCMHRKPMHARRELHPDRSPGKDSIRQPSQCR